MTELTLADLGWSDHFARQLDEWRAEPINNATVMPARLTSIERDRLHALRPEGPVTVRPRLTAGEYAVGDWVLCDGDRALHRLTPHSELARKAAGTQARRQLIAANIDTLGIVTSCNADFNVARLERYLTLAASAGCLPLIILTKADTCDVPQDFARTATRLSPLVTALTLDARDPDEAARLAPWCGPGQTLALVGSSGVGKTTLQNGLTGLDDATAAIRADDARGRHTTTSRHLRRSYAGGWLIDTPGMRELQLTDAGDGIGVVFADIEELAGACKFRDCQHQTEPGCAILAAVNSGVLQADRLERWRKLRREDQHNSQTLSASRRHGRSLAQVIRDAQRTRNKGR